MKKGVVIGIIAGVAVTAAAVIYLKKKMPSLPYYEDDVDDDDYDCDCCCEHGNDCGCDEEIPANKAEESMIVTDACVACGASEEEALDALEDEVESDEV